jgi:hypothetical protein
MKTPVRRSLRRGVPEVGRASTRISSENPTSALASGAVTLSDMKEVLAAISNRVTEAERGNIPLGFGNVAASLFPDDSIS